MTPSPAAETAVSFQPSAQAGAAANSSTMHRKDETPFDRFRRKTVRRNAPAGENMDEILRVLKKSAEQPMTVQEFVGLVSPSTIDNGAVLRLVMNEDIASFQKLARHVYETITQDNSDVLLNEQIQLIDYYNETVESYSKRIGEYIRDIYEIAPNFDFARYFRLGDAYLEMLYPKPDELHMDPELNDTLRRQQAYHRLQWLKSEGERLREENTRLQERLAQMKKQHKQDQLAMLELEHAAERQRESLAVTEARKEDVLEHLNDDVERVIVERETKLRLAVNERALDPREQAAQLEKSRLELQFQAGAASSTSRTPNWRQMAAKEIDRQAVLDATNAEINKLQHKRQMMRLVRGEVPLKRESETSTTTPPPFSQTQDLLDVEHRLHTDSLGPTRIRKVITRMEDKVRSGSGINPPGTSGGQCDNTECK